VKHLGSGFITLQPTFPPLKDFRLHRCVKGTRIRETDARVFSSGGYTEEKFEEEEILLAKENAECCFLSPSIPKLSGQQQSEACSIEKIEQRAKASLEKLRNILYAVKTRTPDPTTLPSEYHDSYEQGKIITSVSCS
jgi:hypothetical protein